MTPPQVEKLRQIEREISQVRYWIEAESRKLAELERLRDRLKQAMQPQCCGQCQGNDR